MVEARGGLLLSNNSLMAETQVALACQAAEDLSLDRIIFEGDSLLLAEQYQMRISPL